MLSRLVFSPTWSLSSTIQDCTELCIVQALQPLLLVSPPPMSLSIPIALLPDESGSVPYERVLLQADDPNTPAADLAIEQLELVHSGRSEVYTGTLLGDSGAGTLVVCKLAFSRDARRRVANEACFYYDKLKDLQGVWVPRCYGLYVGHTSFGPTSCLVLSYCGARIEGELEELDVSFKKLLVQAVIDLHNADIVHGNLLEDVNILDDGGRPVIIDFGDATEEKCQADVVQFGTLQPDEFDFPCEELLDFLTVLRIWKPRNILYIGSVRPVSLMKDPRKLAATAPDWWPWEAAMQEAYRVILLHAKEYYPKKYKAYVMRNEKYIQEGKSVWTIEQLENSSHWYPPPPGRVLGCRTIR